MCLDQLGGKMRFKLVHQEHKFVCIPKVEVILDDFRAPTCVTVESLTQ